MSSGRWYDRSETFGSPCKCLWGPTAIDAGAIPVGLATRGTTTLDQVRCGWVESEGTWPVRDDLVKAVELAASEL
jgi:hypothetical protein